MCYVYESKWGIFGLNFDVDSSWLTHCSFASELVKGENCPITAYHRLEVFHSADYVMHMKSPEPDNITLMVYA